MGDMTAEHPPDQAVSLLPRLRRLDASTVSDANRSLRVLAPSIRPISAARRFAGRALTAHAPADLLSVLGALRIAGPDDVLVIGTGGSPRAVLGEIFAGEAARRGIAGIVIDGFCRDSATLRRMQLPIFASGVTPRAAEAKVLPQVGVPVVVGGVRVDPGDLLVGDDDGIVVGSVAELAAVIDAAEGLQRTEEALCSDIGRGVPLFDRLNFDEHVAALERGEDSSLSFA